MGSWEPWLSKEMDDQEMEALCETMGWPCVGLSFPAKGKLTGSSHPHHVCGPSAGLIPLPRHSSSKDGSPCPALFVRTWCEEMRGLGKGQGRGTGREGS